MVYQGEPRQPPALFCAHHYGPDYPGLAGRDLTPGYPLERYRSPDAGIAETPRQGSANDMRLAIAPNPFRTGTTILLSTGIARRARVSIIDAAGRVVRVLARRIGRRAVTALGRERRFRQAGEPRRLLLPLSVRRPYGDIEDRQAGLAG